MLYLQDSMPLVSRWILSASSYAPLFALLALVTWHGHLHLAIAFLALSGFLALVLLALMLYLESVLSTWRVQLDEARGKTEELGAYAATYLLPFLAFAFDRWENVLALFLFIAFLAFIYVRARLPYLNPLLLIFGYRLVEVHHRDPGASPSDARISVAVTKGEIASGQIVRASYVQRTEATNIGVLLVKTVE
jgi:hypothetical protein